MIIYDSKKWSGSRNYDTKAVQENAKRLLFESFYREESLAEVVSWYRPGLLWAAGLWALQPPLPVKRLAPSTARARPKWPCPSRSF